MNCNTGTISTLACSALDSLHLRIRVTAQVKRSHGRADDDEHAGRGSGLCGNPPLVSANKSLAACNRAHRYRTELLHPAKHINHRPAILHLPIHDAEQAHLLNLEALARRRDAEECAWTLVRSAHRGAGSNLVSLGNNILEREVEIRESAPQQSGDLLEVLAAIRSERLVVVDGIGSNEFINDAQISLVKEFVGETSGDRFGVFG